MWRALTFLIFFSDTIKARIESEIPLPGYSSESLEKDQRPACEVQYFRQQSLAAEKRQRDEDLYFITDDNMFRIKNGTKTKSENYPFVVIYGGKCSGTLITLQWVLTSAHCGDKPNYIAFGADVKCSCNQVPVCAHFVHPLWREDEENHDFDYDYQLLLLTRRLEPAPHVRPIPMGNADDIKAGTVVTIAGFGVSNKGNKISKHLHTLQLPIMSREKCVTIPHYLFSTITHRMFCVGSDKSPNEPGTCPGDSGGPVISNGKLVGIVSFSKICATPIGVLKLTKNFIVNWISRTIKEPLPEATQSTTSWPDEF